MKGAEVVTINQVDGTTFDVEFDRPNDTDLWISFNATAITGVVDETYIRTQILARLSYGIGDPADASAITALVKSIAPNVYTDSEEVSDDGISYVPFLTTAAVDDQWVISSIHIIINGTPGP